MYENLEVGTNEARTFTVEVDQTIDFMGEDARVYATPSLVRDIEHTCRDLIHARVPADAFGYAGDCGCYDC